MARQASPARGQLIERGQSAGVVRAYCETQDFGVVVMMVGSVIDAAREVEPELWGRYLTIALQGLRPDSAPLEPLTTPALPPERMEELLTKTRQPQGD